MTDKWSRVTFRRMTGVYPLGAYVLTKPGSR